MRVVLIQFSFPVFSFRFMVETLALFSDSVNSTTRLTTASSFELARETIQQEEIEIPVRV